MTGTYAGATAKVRSTWGNIYVTLNWDEDGKPIEAFARLGKAGESIPSMLEGLMRLCSVALQGGVPIEEIIHQLRGIKDAERYVVNPEGIKSVPDAIGRALEMVLPLCD